MFWHLKWNTSKLSTKKIYTNKWIIELLTFYLYNGRRKRERRKRRKDIDERFSGSCSKLKKIVTEKQPQHYVKILKHASSWIRPMANYGFKSRGQPGHFPLSSFTISPFPGVRVFTASGWTRKGSRTSLPRVSQAICTWVTDHVTAQKCLVLILFISNGRQLLLEWKIKSLYHQSLAESIKLMELMQNYLLWLIQTAVYRQLAFFSIGRNKMTAMLGCRTPRWRHHWWLLVWQHVKRYTIHGRHSTPREGFIFISLFVGRKQKLYLHIF